MGKKASGKENKVTVFSLAPNSALDEEDAGNSAIYYNYLDTAFKNETICNIAVTGSYGTGKSSILRTFEMKRRQPLERKKRTNFKKNSRFLYISLGEFIEEEDGDTDGGKVDGLKGKSAQSIEQRLLLQIYSRFGRDHLPSSSFPLVRENPAFPAVKAALGVLLFISVFALIFHETAGTFLDYFRTEAKIFRGFWVFLWDSKTKIHALFYVLTIILSAGGIGLGVYHLLYRFKLDDVSLKSDHAEVAVKRAEKEVSLDAYSQELIYALEQVAEEIDFTVVFEDMDRLGKDTSVELFTKLREINMLVNSRMAHRKKQKGHLRFVYVISDVFSGYLERTKFFDYILTVIPTLVYDNSYEKFMVRLNKALVDLDSRFDMNSFDGAFESVINTIIDYRMQFAITNDFSLLFSINKLGNELGEEDLNALLALAIYKNVFPEDYSGIRAGKSIVLPDTDTEKMEKIADESKRKLLSTLVGIQKEKWMRLLGYSENEIAEIRKKNILDGIKAGNPQLLRKPKLIYGPEDIKTAKLLCDELNKEAELLSGLQTEQQKVDVQRLLLIYFLNCSAAAQFNYTWFFKQDVWDILEVLESLKIRYANVLFRVDDNVMYFTRLLNEAKITSSNSVWTEKRLELVIAGTKGECPSALQSVGISVIGRGDRKLADWYADLMQEAPTPL